MLLRAYDDEAGVTEAFNKNVLVRINRELGGSFNPRLFRPRARWNQEHSRIEMHLESLIPQQVTIGALDLEVRPDTSVLSIQTPRICAAFFYADPDRADPNSGSTPIPR